jgi:hypothetical protein
MGQCQQTEHPVVEPQKPRKRAGVPPRAVKLVAHSLDGQHLLGPEEFREGLTVAELREKLVASGKADPDSALKCVLGDQVLNGADMIQNSNCSHDPLTVQCIFMKGIHIKADHRERKQFQGTSKDGGYERLILSAALISVFIALEL